MCVLHVRCLQFLLHVPLLLFLHSAIVRDIAGEPVDPANPWASREFYVKWKGFSYLHCSWDRLDTLKQLPGHKRVLNYMKRVEDMEHAKGLLSREEQELLDVQRQMEEQLAEQYTQVWWGGVVCYPFYLLLRLIGFIKQGAGISSQG